MDGLGSWIHRGSGILYTGREREIKMKNSQSYCEGVSWGSGGKGYKDCECASRLYEGTPSDNEENKNNCASANDKSFILTPW